MKHEAQIRKSEVLNSESHSFVVSSRDSKNKLMTSTNYR